MWGNSQLLPWTTPWSINNQLLLHKSPQLPQGLHCLSIAEYTFSNSDVSPGELNGIEKCIFGGSGIQQPCQDSPLTEHHCRKVSNMRGIPHLEIVKCVKIVYGKRHQQYEVTKCLFPAREVCASLFQALSHSGSQLCTHICISQQVCCLQRQRPQHVGNLVCV